MPNSEKVSSLSLEILNETAVPVKQEDPLGCGVACVASVLNIDYKDALNLFENGEVKAKTEGFLCQEIVTVLSKVGLRFEYRYLKSGREKKIYRPNTIVFLARSKKYPTGHYLLRAGNQWMDPWINFPEESRKAGFRKKLPEEPIYIIYQI